MTAISMTPERRLLIARIVALALVIGISLYLFTLPEEQIARLEAYGYPGIFLLSILVNATILLPVPGVLLVFSMGAVFHPLGVALAAGTGAAIGELSGYLAGFSGQAVLERNDIYQRMVDWMQRYGSLAVVALAFLPNPFFDLTGMAAGALKMRVSRFLFWCVIGKIMRMLVIAYAGAGLFNLPWLNNLFRP